MMKRVLSVIMVLTVFFGGYAVLPKKYNPLPVNDAYCATKNYGGLYYVNKTFTEYYTGTVITKGGIPMMTKLPKVYKAGSYVSLTPGGYDSSNTKIDLRSYTGKELGFVRR